MDSFEQVVATVLDREGYWVRTSVKVSLSAEEKREIGRPSAPRWELDIVAYSGQRNELLVVECKSYLDSYGVRATSFDGPKVEEEKRYKLFNDAVLRRVVLQKLERQLVSQGFCPEGTTATLCLAAGNIYGDPAPLRAIFAKNGWRLFQPSWVIDGLRKLADESYENSVASVVAKMLLRDASESLRSAASSGESATTGETTRPGYKNTNGQVVVRSTALPGTDFGQSIYVLRCTYCSEEYGANGSDIWQRKCPQCQEGRPGLAF